MYLYRVDLRNEENGSNKPHQEVAYWRKANQIHGWFVDNFLGGKDECRPSSVVTLDDLLDLRSLCQAILRNNTEDDPNVPYSEWQDTAATILPTRSGCFFGDTTYGENYLYDIENTIKQINEIEATHEGGHHMYFYESSW